MATANSGLYITHAFLVGRILCQYCRIGRKLHKNIQVKSGETGNKSIVLGYRLKKKPQREFRHVDAPLWEAA
jgi:hypothetical protein